MTTQQRGRGPKRPAMTEKEATSFQRFSIYNAATVLDELQQTGSCKTGECEPYRDMYTYARWQAQGFQVRRGEHGSKIPVMGQAEEEDATGAIVTRGFKTVSTVFCRCQVDKKEVN